MRLRNSIKYFSCTLLALLLVACGDNSRVSRSVEPSETKRLEGQLTDLRLQLKELQAASRKNEELLRSKTTELERVSTTLLNGVKYLANSTVRRGELLRYFGLHDISGTNDPYGDILGLTLWYKEPSYHPDPYPHFFKNFPRSSDNIDGLFARHSDDIFAVLTKETYRKSLAKSYVDALLFTHSRIHAATDHTAWLEAMSKDPRISESKNKRLLLAEYEAKFGAIDSGMALVKRSTEATTTDIKFWAYSFWLRRHIENNADSVARILNATRKRLD